MKKYTLTIDHLKNIVKLDFSLRCEPPCLEGQRCVQIEVDGGGFKKTCINIEDFLSVVNGEKNEKE